MQVIPNRAAPNPMPARSPHFNGQQEYQTFKQKMAAFPADSVERLAEIKRLEVAEAPKHAKHVQLALAIGKVDQSIAWLNAQIMSLIGERQRGKQARPAKRDDLIVAARTADQPTEDIQAKAKEYLGDLRQAQDDTLTQHGYTTQGEKA
jgi:hypothetical protein